MKKKFVGGSKQSAVELPTGMEDRTFTFDEMLVLTRKMISDEGLNYDYVREWLNEHGERTLEDWRKKRGPTIHKKCIECGPNGCSCSD